MLFRLFCSQMVESAALPKKKVMRKLNLLQEATFLAYKLDYLFYCVSVVRIQTGL
jgi:hypothetical protein